MHSTRLAKLHLRAINLSFNFIDTIGVGFIFKEAPEAVEPLHTGREENEDPPTILAQKAPLKETGWEIRAEHLA
ncbi:hypothetical protein G9A89_003842 [Geosiphon pyriformis]|nr:hypothetical protein G9A89_003842 [Geosiphon pyriformis]